MADAIGCAVRPHQIQEERALSVGGPVIHKADKEVVLACSQLMSHHVCTVLKMLLCDGRVHLNAGVTIANFRDNLGKRE